MEINSLNSSHIKQLGLFFFYVSNFLEKAHVQYHQRVVVFVLTNGVFRRGNGIFNENVYTSLWCSEEFDGSLSFALVPPHSLHYGLQCVRHLFNTKFYNQLPVKVKDIPISPSTTFSSKHLCGKQMSHS